MLRNQGQKKRKSRGKLRGKTTTQVNIASCVQGSPIRPFQGLVNFVPAVAYYFCLNVPAAFSQPGAHLILEPCMAMGKKGASVSHTADAKLTSLRKYSEILRNVLCCFPIFIFCTLVFLGPKKFISWDMRCLRVLLEDKLKVLQSKYKYKYPNTLRIDLRWTKLSIVVKVCMHISSCQDLSTQPNSSLIRQP